MVSLRILNLAGFYQLAAMLISAALCFALWREGVSGVLLGGAVMSINLFIMRTVVAKMVGNPTPRAMYGVLLVFKFAVICGLVVSIMTFIEPDLLAFMAGLSSFFVGMAGAMLHQTFGATAPVANRSV